MEESHHAARVPSAHQTGTIKQSLCRERLPRALISEPPHLSGETDWPEQGPSDQVKPSQHSRPGRVRTTAEITTTDGVIDIAFGKQGKYLSAKIDKVKCKQIIATNQIDRTGGHFNKQESDDPGSDLYDAC